jgi:hypothetical protein
VTSVEGGHQHMDAWRKRKQGPSDDERVKGRGSRELCVRAVFLDLQMVYKL